MLVLVMPPKCILNLGGKLKQGSCSDGKILNVISEKVAQSDE
jgi:hypothetical protein